MSKQNPLSASLSLYRYECFLFLMYVAIIGALARPSFINDIILDMPSEAKEYLSSMNREQKVYFGQKSAFATSIDALEIGIKTETANYKYSTRATKTASFNYAIAKEKNLKSYVGGVFIVPAKTTNSILCEADDRGTIEPAEPIYKNGKVICGKGTTEVPR
ncbi:type IV pilin-like G/H family protein [Microcoleus sp. herbarium14]|uniref:type IV pilin-like G/H family protein n=1 Tax=Microcoleus sp. herbarium14 TaxID=3055439 RepID=UPI002FCEE4A6